MGYIKILGSMAFAGIIFGATAAAAQDTDTIVVTATRAKTSLADVPESVSVVTRQDVAAIPANALDEILRSVPSVNLPTMASYQLHPNLDTVSMRGLGGGRALVLLDGVPLNDPFYGYVQWNLVPLATVDRVEVERGAGSALWGNYAMGGVINVVTRRVPTEPALALDVAGGSYGTVRADGYAALPLSPGIRIAVDASRFRTDGYDPVSAAYRVPLTVPSRFHADNVGVTTEFDLDPTLSGAVRASYHDTSGILHTPANGTAQRAWNVSGDLAKRFSSSTLTLTAFHTYSRLTSDNSATPPGGVAGTVEYVQNHHETPATSDGGSLVWSMESQGWVRRISLGTDLQALHGTDAGLIYNIPGVLTRTDGAEGRQTFVGVFAQTELVPVTDLHVLASARVQYFRNFDGFDGSPGGGGVVPATSKTSFNPRLSLRYDITPAVAIRAAGYSAFRAPVMNSLYRSFSNRFGIFYSNAALKPETLRGGEGGFDINLHHLRAQMTYYYNSVDDLLTTRSLLRSELPAGFNFGTRNINAGQLEAQGFEGEITWQPVERLTAVIGYAYAHSIITANPADPRSVGKQLGGVPRQSGSFRLAYASGNGWKLAGNLYWHDKLFSDNAQTLPIGSQLIMGVSASYPVSARFEPYVSIQNLFNERNVASNAGTSAPELETPLTALVGVRTHF